jgi:hypothetical protein
MIRRLSLEFRQIHFGFKNLRRFMCTFRDDWNIRKLLGET